MSRIICHCETCEGPIYEGDRVYNINDVLHHENCINDMSVADLIDVLDLTTSQILDLLEIYVNEAEDNTGDIDEETAEDFYRYYE